MAKRVLLFGDAPDVALDEFDSAVDHFDIGGIIIKSALGIDLGGFKATNSALPTGPADLANKAYVDAATPALTGGVGIDYSAPTISVDLAAVPGLEFDSNKLRAKLNGPTLQRAAAGLSVLGVPVNFQVNGVATGATVTAPALTGVTDGGNADAYHTHSGGSIGNPDEAGQVLYAATAAGYTNRVPIIGPQGWLHGGGKLIVK